MDNEHKCCVRGGEDCVGLIAKDKDGTCHRVGWLHYRVTVVVEWCDGQTFESSLADYALAEIEGRSQFARVSLTKEQLAQAEVVND